MGNCKLVDELNRLRKSSSDSIDGIGTFDDFKKYMHVSRSAEKDLIEILHKIEDSGRKSLVMLCGSAGDGKSHLLSYLKNDLKLLDNYVVYNDATESSAPSKTAIETLNEALQGFSDENLEKPGENFILAINLGVLSNFIESSYGDSFKQLEQCAKHVETQLNRRDISKKKIDEIDNYLSVDIDEKALNRIFKRIKELEKEILTEEVNLSSLQQKRTTVHGAAMIAESEFSKAVEQLLSSLESNDDNKRVVKYAHMAIEIIKRYRIRLQQRKTDILADTMTDCYKKLAYKKHLIEKIKMDPVTLDIHYLNGNDEEVEKKKLSAGEKQLMVISLLWALAICSKKKLPVIIDTPLSRLDSIHREALISTYFPNASDQTIILSTDSEINQKYYKLMKPHIGDEFTLVYDDELMKTTIKKGYLFEGK